MENTNCFQFDSSTHSYFHPLYPGWPVMCLRHQSDSPWLLALISVARVPGPGLSRPKYYTFKIFAGSGSRAACADHLTSAHNKYCKWCSSKDFYFTLTFKKNLFTWIVNKAQRTKRKCCRRVNYNELDYGGKKVRDVTISWHQSRQDITAFLFIKS